MKIVKISEKLGDGVANAIDSLQDAMVDISDDWSVSITGNNWRNIIIEIDGSTSGGGKFFDRRKFNGDSYLSLSDIEDGFKSMRISSQVLEKIWEAINRSGIDHDSIKIDIRPHKILVEISLIK